MFPLTVGIAVVGLGALGALGELVASLAALETLENRDPQRLLLVAIILLFGTVTDGMLRGGAAVKYLPRMFGGS